YPFVDQEVLPKTFASLMLRHNVLSRLTLTVGLRIKAIINISLTMQLVQPVLKSRFSAALEENLPCLHTLELFFHVFRTPFFDHNQMPAKRRTHRLADLAWL